MAVATLFRPGFLDYFRSGQFADIQILAGSKTYRAHRMVLAFSSEFFEAMLLSDFQETHTDVIDLTNLHDPQNVFPEVLKIFYTGRVELTEAKVVPLLAMSDVLMMKIVKEKCMEFIATHLNKSTALRFLVDAIALKQESLAQQCLVVLAASFLHICDDTDFSGLDADHFVQLVTHPRLAVHSEWKLFLVVIRYLQAHNIHHYPAPKHPELTKIIWTLMSNVRFFYFTLEQLIEASRNPLVPPSLLLDPLLSRLALMESGQLDHHFYRNNTSSISSNNSTTSDKGETADSASIPFTSSSVPPPPPPPPLPTQHQPGQAQPPLQQQAQQPQAQIYQTASFQAPLQQTQHVQQPHQQSSSTPLNISNPVLSQTSSQIQFSSGGNTFDSSPASSSLSSSSNSTSALPAHPSSILTANQLHSAHSQPPASTPSLHSLSSSSSSNASASTSAFSLSSLPSLFLQPSHIRGLSTNALPPQLQFKPRLSCGIHFEVSNTTSELSYGPQQSLPTGSTRGIIHWLGTKEGTASWSNPAASGIVSVHASSVERGHPHNLVELEPQDLWTHDVPASWLSVDLGRFRVLPHAYMLRHGGNYRADSLRNWDFQGSVDGKHWVVLKRHSNDTTLAAPFAASIFTIDKAVSIPYQWFRIIQTGHNSTNHNFLVLSGFELYGELWDKDAWNPSFMASSSTTSSQNLAPTFSVLSLSNPTNQTISSPSPSTPNSTPHPQIRSSGHVRSSSQPSASSLSSSSSGNVVPSSGSSSSSSSSSSLFQNPQQT